MAVPLALFCCDASPIIGAGHVMRCLALAEALGEAGWRISFTVGKEAIPTVPALTTTGFDVCVLSDADRELEALRERASGRADLLVVDHYKRGVAFETSCRAFAQKILVLDDATGRNHDCDILVDAAASSGEFYTGHVPAHARVLAGPAYALVRRSFVAHREMALARRDGRPVKEILVSCGATDPRNATVAVLESLDDIANNIAITVVLSSLAPHVDAVRKRLQGKTRLLTDVAEMADLMANADLAIGASGSTAYERAVVGLPSILVTIADNQRGIARQMAEVGATLDGGTLDRDLAARLRALVEFLLSDAGLRRRLAQAASVLIDGRGALRIALAILDGEDTKKGAQIRLRLAVPDDERPLLKIQQDPQTRRYFRNSVIPTAEEHHDWMRRTLADPKQFLLIVEADGLPIGSVRLNRLTDQVGTARHEVSIAIDPAWHGRGIGSATLHLVRRLMPGAVLDATILLKNQISRALFKGAGYVALSGNLYRSVPEQVSGFERESAQRGLLL
jgi:UDP-2,4-diacetamido-2,4,6-trideoxy-beta-L-altropyranose hydrolase